MAAAADYHIQTLAEALGPLISSPFLAGACAYIARHAQAIEAELGERVIVEIPAFLASNNPDLLPELATHAREHVDEILRLLSDGRVGDFAFVRDHGRRRAEQYFPLEATLHAYRCGHRVFAHWLREAALASVPSPGEARDAVASMADFGLEYTDAISTVVAASYLAQTRLQAEVAGDRRAQLMALLLDGHDESDQRIARTLRLAGFLDRRQSFCVALVQPVEPAEMANPERARRLADAVDSLLKPIRARRLVDVREHHVAAIVSHDRRASGWTAPREPLASQVTRALALAGNAVLVGVSGDVPSTASIPAAYSEATVALELADISHRVVGIGEVPLQRLLVHLAREDLQRVLPSWSQSFLVSDERAGGTLSTTLRAYAAADMNALKAAKDLSVHPNTLYARLKKIERLTGLNARSYRALTDLLIVSDSALAGQGGDGRGMRR